MTVMDGGTAPTLTWRARPDDARGDADTLTRSMRVLWLTHGSYESDFYGRVSAELATRGHESAHVTWSRVSARAWARRGMRTYVLPHELRAAGVGDAVEAEARRIEATYDIRSLRDVWR